MSLTIIPIAGHLAAQVSAHHHCILDVFSGVYLITSSDVTVRVGEQLQLNCTVVGADNSSKYQLSWYHGKQKLGENVIAKLRNNTVQVNIDAVDWNNNGTYVCKETANSGLQPRSVVVRVGGRSSSYCAFWHIFCLSEDVYWGLCLCPCGMHAWKEFLLPNFFEPRGLAHL